jgi:hypothetical protein
MALGWDEMKAKDVRKRLTRLRSKFGLTTKEAKGWYQSEPDFTKGIASPLRTSRFAKLSERPLSKHTRGLKYDFTREGPIVYGGDTMLSASESNALLDRYFGHLHKFVRQEMKRHQRSSDALMGGHIRAVMRACADTYNGMPSEKELKRLKTELSRKFNLFYNFTTELMIHAIGED